MIRLSLVIATHNRASQLLVTLESVVRQDLPAAEWECVVVSNNCTDDTSVRFAAFAAVHPAFNLRLVDEPQPGVSHARNRGVLEAKAPLVAIIDDDERVSAGFMRAYLDFFDAHPEAVVAGGRIIAEYPAGRPAWMSKRTEKPVANPMDYGPRVRPYQRGAVPGGGNMAFRRLVVDSYGGFDPSLGRTGSSLVGGEETDFFARLVRGGVTLWYVPDAVIWHIIPPEKLTEAYFRRLCYNVGVSQRLQARKRNRYGRALLSELFKWGGTLFFCLFNLPRQSRWLLLMRREISRGLFDVCLRKKH